MISTRARYTLRVLIDLAEHNGGGYTPLKEVAERQELSQKYLERILPALVEGKLIEGLHGKGGGYRLTKEPEDYTVWEVLLLTEGDMAPVSCLEKGAPPCARAAECRTLPLWEGYREVTKEYFSSITLRDLMKTDAPANYVI